MYVWNATALYLMRDFIYRKMALLWDHICHALIVILGYSDNRFDHNRYYTRYISYTPKALYWKRFRDDIFAVWNNSLQELQKFFEVMNSIDASGKIKFTMSIANNDSILGFLD